MFLSSCGALIPHFNISKRGIYFHSFKEHSFKSFSSLLFVFGCFPFLPVPELQGEPDEISKEKARLAAIQVSALPVDFSLFFFFLSFFFFLLPITNLCPN